MDWGRIRIKTRGRVEIPGLDEPGFVSDASPADESPRRQRFDPDAGRRIRFRRRATAFVLGSVFLAGGMAAIVGQGGYLERKRLEHQNAALDAEVDAAMRRVARLKADVSGLENDPLYRERVAREQLGLVRPGEVNFMLPRDP